MGCRRATLEEEREEACATTLIRIESDPSLAILKRKHDFADISSVPPPISTKPWFSLSAIGRDSSSIEAGVYVTVGRRRERVPAVAPVASAAGCCACAAAIVVAAAVVRRERGRAWATCFPPPIINRLCCS